MGAHNTKVALCVRENPGISATCLAEQFGVSSRTVRTYIRECNDSMAGIASVEYHRAGPSGSGYYLEVADEAGFEDWLERARGFESRSASVPSTHEERVRFLINDLLLRTDWITVEGLADILFVSAPTVSAALCDVEKRVERFGLSLERRPRHGLRVTGPELSRRLCLASVAVDSLGFDGSRLGGDGVGESDWLARISSCVSSTSEETGFQINSMVYQNLIVHIAVALTRINDGCYVPMDDPSLREVEQADEMGVAQALARKIEGEFGVNLPREEVAYMAIHLAGKRMLAEGSGESQGSLVISDEVWGVVAAMLERVYQAFRFDFRDDLELSMNLARHIVPLTVRMRYRMPMDNPLLTDIKAHFPLAYSMAADASVALCDHYKATLSDAEIGYLALAFALALERQKTAPQKKNILVVCASGQGSARLLEYRYRQEFGKTLGSIQTCDVSRVNKVDFTDIDYVFTTVPLPFSLPVPVREVNFFLDGADVVGVREMLQRRRREGLLRYFDERLFFSHLTFETKEAALDYLCGCVIEARRVDDDFKELVLLREEYAPTSFGNYVALPHPLRAASDESFVCVALLDSPIPWNGHPVQAIFLLVVSREKDEGLEAFYDRLSELLLSPEEMQTLIADQRLETLERLFGEDSLSTT